MRATCATRICNLRKQRHVTQKYVSFILNIPPRTYSDYESGRCRIPLPVLIDLARFYDVDLNYITGVSNIRKEFPQA